MRGNKKSKWLISSRMNPPERMEDGDEELDMENVKRRFRRFLLEYSPMPSSEHYYRKRILHNYRNNKIVLVVDLEHVNKFDATLIDMFISKPERCLEVFHSVAKEILDDIIRKDKASEDNDDDRDDIMSALKVKPERNYAKTKVDTVELVFEWGNHNRTQSLRKLEARNVSKLIFIDGIITKASRYQHQLTRATFECNVCKTTQIVYTRDTDNFLLQPPKCLQENLAEKGKKCGGMYSMRMRDCQLKDSQILKVQELPENVPTGEIPQSLTIILQKQFVERIPPGTRVNVIGIFSSGLYKLNIPFIQVIGIKKQHKFSNVMDRNIIPIFSDEEEKQFLKLSRTRDLYKIIARSIDPGVFGHFDIKKAIACQLFGGTPRQFKDGNRRRGDIHLLLLGDPSTAKSQLLKYGKTLAPIGVYTSGKGSSAAGLTASVVREPSTREFYLEGGSMVLADGGLCCIDEFDKMSESDRVAIHEAMEQQTISLAKAGITTVLNSRTSVLAAANPIGGKYIDFLSTEEQIDFQTTILSRFDLIFIVQDKLSASQDRHIADHIKNVMYTESGERIRRRDGAGVKGGSIGRVGKGRSAIVGATSSQMKMLDEDDDEDEEEEEEEEEMSPNLGGDDSMDDENSVFEKKSERRRKLKKSDRDALIIPQEELTSYISYCRRKCFPALNQEAAEHLVDFYVEERKKRGGYIPITVRQLEALIRITEALAKMYLQPVATKMFAEEAVRLFQSSTVKAIRSGQMGAELLRDDRELEKIEAMIKGRVAVKSTVQIEWLHKVLEKNDDSSISRSKLDKTIYVMVKKGDLEYRNKRQRICRKK